LGNNTSNFSQNFNTSAAGTTVRVGIYKMCQNGTEEKIDRGWQMINKDGEVW
jgi:hypothetical protein